MKSRVIRIALAVIASLSLVGAVHPQSKKRHATKAPAHEEPDRRAETRAALVVAAKAYKESLEKVRVLQEAQAKDAADSVEKRKQLFEQGVVSKREVEDGERELASIQSKLSETRRQMTESDELIAEATAAEQLDKLPAPSAGSYVATAALIRYNGIQWALTDVAKIETFFTTSFKHTLPISAYGQTPVHDRLGFDHSNSIDVALHPDSAEGQALMSYLRGAGIPFIAFRSAVPGSATGAHIHIGYPSHRMSK